MPASDRLLQLPFLLSALALVVGLSGCQVPERIPPASKGPPLKLAWKDNYLRIRGENIPGGEIEILYLEDYCRANSQTTDWNKHTVVGHSTTLVSASEDGSRIELRCILKDGVVVDHVISSSSDEVDFRLRAHNPTDKVSEAHWAQPCMRVGDFTGLGHPDNRRTYDYIKKSFVFLDGKLSLMPTKDWALEARYTPGQVWAAPGVPRADVNPRPLSKHVPSNGLIGCFSADDSQVLTMVWEPYQELFQGVLTCLHSDFRLGGLAPGATLDIRGKVYITANDIPALLKRYARDFPGHRKLHRRR
ncbi:MAG: hypothetical protein VX254_09515 [Planctomycetota bacterium]|nr:hypothetical protein [Planctomycetota bacterium]